MINITEVCIRRHVFGQYLKAETNHFECMRETCKFCFGVSYCIDYSSEGIPIFTLIKYKVISKAFNETKL